MTTHIPAGVRHEGDIRNLNAAERIEQIAQERRAARMHIARAFVMRRDTLSEEDIIALCRARPGQIVHIRRNQ